MRKTLRYSLKTKILVSFLCVSIISMIVVLSYDFIVQQKALKQQLEADSERDISHSLDQMENQMIQISDFVSWAVNNEDIQERLHRESDIANRYDDQLYSVITQLTDQLSYRPISKYLRGLFILGNNGLDIRSGSEASFIISWLLTQMIAAPLERVITRVHGISNGYPPSKKRRVERSEIDYLENCISDMHEALMQAMQQERQQEHEKQQLEIRVLQEQMNPHFLYHALNTIRLMAAMQGKQSIAKMTEMLIQLMRASLSHSEAKVTVKQELSFWESYMYIQNISKKGQLQWDASDISDELLTQEIPKLLLQPLAENAISHGFSDKNGIGIIRLHGRREGNIMLLCMEDNGVGIDSSRLAEITDVLQHPEKSLRTEDTSSHGMALVNIQRRIQLHDGKMFGLTVESEYGNGCRVIIRLPFTEKIDEGMKNEWCTDC